MEAAAANIRQMLQRGLSGRPLPSTYEGKIAIVRSNYLSVINHHQIGPHRETTRAMLVREKLLRALAGLSAALVVVGLIIGFAAPGPITGALLPIGLTLWMAVGFFARRMDSSASG
jgi:hypothetical protein